MSISLLIQRNSTTEAYLGLCQTSVLEPKLVAIFVKSSIIGV